MIVVLLGKITALRENNLIWSGLGVQACHIQLFSSLDVYLQLNFFADVADKVNNNQPKEHKTKLSVQFGVQDFKLKSSTAKFLQTDNRIQP